MANKSSYSRGMNDFHCTLEVSPNQKSKFIIKKKTVTLCEIEFVSVVEFMNLIDELQALGEQWVAEQEYDLGLREFYFET